MRYYNYLNEDKFYNDDIELLKQTLNDKCYLFLNDVNGHFLYRGVKTSDHQWAIRSVITNRKPKDNTLDVHNMFDKVFYEKFGWKARSNSIFCSGSFSIASDYGEHYIVFPIGKYNFLYSKHVKDLYLDMIKPKMESKIYELIEKYDIYGIDKNINQFNWIKIFNKNERKKYNIEDKMVYNLTKDICSLYIKNKNIVEAIKSYTEIMINCKEYVEVNEYFYKKNQQLFGDIL